MSQQLRDVLFLHWPVPEAWLCGHLPPALELDLYKGQAWLSVVLFKARNTHLRGIPALPGMREFLQLNVRTYVRYGMRRGVYFFSMDANSRAAIEAASLGGFLPYRYSRVNMEKQGNQIQFKSSHGKGVQDAEGIELFYRPQEELAELASVERWLLERYCLWTQPKGRLYRLEIGHPPWRIQYVKGEILRNTLAGFLPEQLHRLRPIAHYSTGTDVFFYPPVVEKSVKKH